jgi:hypothetical protein
MGPIRTGSAGSVSARRAFRERERQRQEDERRQAVELELQRARASAAELRAISNELITVLRARFGVNVVSRS